MVWGADISKTKTAIAIGRAGSKPRFVSVVGSGMDTFDAAWKLCKVLIELYATDRPDHIFYEAPLAVGVYGRKTIDPETGEEKSFSGAQAAMALMSMTTAVTLFADGSRIPRRAVNVQSARKAFLGRPRFKDKNDGKRHAKAMAQELGWNVKNLDEADSAAVWYFGCFQAATKYVVPILPSMQAKVAAQFAGAPIERDDSLLRRTFR